MYDRSITDSHPMRSKNPIRYKADEIAIKLVGERHDKRDLINLVRWLIMDKSSTINEDLNNDIGTR